MKSAVSLITMSVLCLAIGACSSIPEQDIRLAPKLSEAEKQVIAEKATLDGRTIEESVVMYNSQVDKKDQVICKKEWVTGTRISEIVCRTAEQRKREADEAWDFMRHNRNVRLCPVAGTCNTGAGGDP